MIRTPEGRLGVLALLSAIGAVWMLSVGEFTAMYLMLAAWLVSILGIGWTLQWTVVGND